MEISDRHRRFLRIEQSLIPGIFNLALNAAIAWLVLRAHPEIPLWGEASVGVDLLATGFMLPFFTCLIVSRLIGGQIRGGKLPPLEPHQIASHGWHRRSVLQRGLFLGVVGVVLAAAPLVTLLELGRAQPIPLYSFVGFKAVWAGLFAAVISPVIAWWALASASRGDPNPTAAVGPSVAAAALSASASSPRPDAGASPVRGRD